MRRLNGFTRPACWQLATGHKSGVEINAVFWASSHKYTTGNRKCDYSERGGGGGRRNSPVPLLLKLQTQWEYKQDASADYDK